MIVQDPSRTAMLMPSITTGKYTLISKIFNRWFAIRLVLTLLAIIASIIVPILICWITYKYELLTQMQVMASTFLGCMLLRLSLLIMEDVDFWIRKYKYE